MKRKRSQDLAAAHACPQVAKKYHCHLQQSNDKPCSLLRILAQYGLLVSIVSNLTPKDLDSLAATSKATYKAMFSGKASRLALLRKMPCEGKGVAIRRARHKLSPYSTGYECQEYVECGSNDTGRDVETRPCDGCNETTCEECRIHCVYQTIFQQPEPPSPPDLIGDLPIYSGFALLSPWEMEILTPSNFKLAPLDEPVERPYHDQGFLDVPYELQVSGQPESVDAILDFDLGQGPLQLPASSNAHHPSPVIQPFWEYTEERKIRACQRCRLTSQAGELGHDALDRATANEMLRRICNCTLRNRILKRWVCIPCFERERAHARAHSDYQTRHPKMCSYKCGRRHWDKTLTCLWCKGKVLEPKPST